MRSLRLSFPVIVTALSSSVICDGNHHHGHSRTGGLLGGGNNDNNGGGGGVSSGYGVPSGGYGAPSGGYGAPSGGGGGVSSGYGAPSGGGGGVSSGYGAPSSGYGGGGGGAPVYVYQQGQDDGGDGGGLAGGLLAALLPLGALALVGGLGLVTFGALFPATTVVAGRRKRSVYDNSTVQEQQLELLQSYMDTFDKMPEMNLHKDMVAKYLECGSGPSQSRDSPSLHGCLQKLNCIQNDKTVNLTDVERQVADIILTNEFVSKSLKKSIQVAGKKGSGSPGTCQVFKCHHHLLPQQYGF